MLKYILKRLLLIIPVVIGITLFIYLLLDIGMGDPTALILGPDASAEQVAALRASSAWIRACSCATSIICTTPYRATSATHGIIPALL